MSDLIERLRGHRRHPDNPKGNIFHEAADEIERLQSELNTYRTDNEELLHKIERLKSEKDTDRVQNLMNLKRKDAEIERLREQVEYWQKRHDILRDRHEPQWGNGQ